MCRESYRDRESSGADKKREQQTAGGDDKGVGEEEEERIFTVPSHRGAFHYCQTVRPGWHNGIRFCNKQRVGGPAKKGPRTENGLNVKWRQCRQHGRRLTPRSPPSRQRTTALSSGPLQITITEETTALKNMNRLS